MAVTTRAGKGAPLTHTEIDDNFTAIDSKLSSNTADTKTAGDLGFSDNVKATFGDGNDLQIYHDGGNSIIKDGGTGDLEIQANRLVVQSASGADDFLKVTPSAGVELSHNNGSTVDVKLTTTSSGIDVTGSVTCDGATFDGDLKITAGNKIYMNAPNEDAYIAGDSNSIDFYQWNAGGTGYDQNITILDTGKVGIGTSNPSAFYSGASNLVVGTGIGENGLTISSGNGAGDFGEIFFADGTVGNEAYRGFIQYHHQSDSLQIGTSGTERLRIDSSGRVGVGTSDPDNMMHVYKEASISSHNYTNYPLKIESKDTSGDFWNNQGAGIQFENTASSGSFISAEIVGETDGADGTKGELVLKTSTSSTPTERLRIDSTGNVSIAGTDNRPLKITSFDTTSLGAGWDLDASSGNGKITFSTGGTERLQIGSTGDVLIGKTNYSHTSDAGWFLKANGSGFLVNDFTTVGNEALLFNSTSTSGAYSVSFRVANAEKGSIRVTTSGTSFNTSSDYRLKENVVPMTGSIERLKTLKPSRFNFIADVDKTVDGFLAHEAQEVVPESVHGTKDAMRTEEYEVTPAIEEVRDEDGSVTTEAIDAAMGEREVPDYQGIDQSKLVPLLVSALQELTAKVEALESQLGE